MIYFDNAASGGFKPACVTEAVFEALKEAANPGRSSHKRALAAARTVFSCRELLQKTFNTKTAEEVIFTKNCTEALNLAIFGSFQKGGHVITTCNEHNSVLRPLFFLRDRGWITLTIVAPNENGTVTKESILPHVKEETCLVCICHASNVTGALSPVAEIGGALKALGIPLLVDAAQSAGHVPIDVQAAGISMLAFAGHKALCGPQGTGGLCLNGISLRPLLHGGTGTESDNPSQPTSLPEALESGTLNTPGIAGLLEGVKYVHENHAYFTEKRKLLASTLEQYLSFHRKIKLFSVPNPCGIVSFAVDGMDSATVCDRLNEEFDIAVRGGLHCAPLIHRHLGTHEDGLVRVSIGAHNSLYEIERLVRALITITK